jgi:hypothetical protein
MLQTLNWSTLEKRQLRTRIIFLDKIIHHLVAIYPTNLLTQFDPRTRQYSHSYSYRLIQTTKVSYKYPFFPRTIAQWNLLLVAAVHCTTLDSFREQIPISALEQHFNIWTPHLYSFNLKCIVYKSWKKENNSEFYLLSIFDCIY